MVNKTVFKIAGALGNHFEVVWSLIQCRGWVAAGGVQFEWQLWPSLFVVFWQWWTCINITALHAELQKDYFCPVY